ncbi:MAG: hypothetical protein UX17_C0031G0007 [Parcubacteria group bacterium GW2011_GWC2_45_7]|nr:MAG: hypothetical protein UX17_C0031G0007 [Parcubacteria group bacterium GW2011_GWC2_45_7]KKU72914.1 MAG: hypothetical protein UX98_C0014G0007 [Parcubacteria group bacterium GW2011_GWA2_47_26]
MQEKHGGHQKIRLVTENISHEELRRIATEIFGDMVKVVVDIDRGIMAIGGELHADEEAFLLEDGSRQKDLWGINIYPDHPALERVEFDSMINLRPSQGNRSRSVDDAVIREKILQVVSKLVDWI